MDHRLNELPPRYLGAKLRKLDLPLARAALLRRPFQAAKPRTDPIDPEVLRRVQHGPGGRGEGYN